MNKVILSIIIVITFLLVVSSCNIKMGLGESTYQTITQDEAKRMMDGEEVIVLDVRTKEEYNSGYIKNAVLLPVDEIKERAETILIDKNASILVYCRSGNRSKTASKALSELGYKNVYNFGGINTWKYEIID